MGRACKGKPPKIGALPDGSHKRAGHFDTAGRWYPDRELYDVKGAFHVRGPSRAWPFGYLKHFYTVKFARLLVNSRPELYLELAEIPRESDKGRWILATFAAHRLAA